MLVSSTQLSIVNISTIHLLHLFSMLVKKTKEEGIQLVNLGVRSQYLIVVTYMTAIRQKLKWCSVYFRIT